MDTNPRRRAKVNLGLERLAALIDLPPQYAPLWLYATTDPPSVWVVVTGDHLTELADGEESPILRGWWATEQVVVGGRLFTRWAWAGENDEPVVALQPRVEWVKRVLEEAAEAKGLEHWQFLETDDLVEVIAMLAGPVEGTRRG